MKNKSSRFDVVTVTLNPAIDRTVTIPNFTAGAVNRVEHERDNAGGKGVNVASFLADYGLHVAVAGFLGRENSASFGALFARKNIEDRFVRIAGQTRVGIKITDPVLKQTTDINFPGPAPLATDVAALRKQLAGIDAAWFVIAGSIPPGMDVSIYRDIVSELKSRGGKVVIDTSGDALRSAVEAGPDVIKPNIHELEALVGKSLRTQAEVIDAARDLLSEGINIIAVSMGSEGACFVTKSEVVIARPPEIEVMSTVGAGDAMVAGIVAAQLCEVSMKECARLATAFSIEALTRIESAAISRASLEASSKQVSIEEPATREQSKKSTSGKITLEAARKNFRRARSLASLEQIIASLTGRSAELFSYQEVRGKLKAVETSSQQLRDVTLAAIVGSNVQYEDFTRSFLPRRDHDEELWSMVEVVASGAQNPPPIELYQLGNAYFVKDGHYRVSVARQRGDKQIRARVTEVRTTVPLSPALQPADLILISEHADFLAQTHLDKLRPGAGLSVTSPESYSELAEHIEVHRYFMGIDQKRAIPYEEAAAHWFDEVYAPVVEIIRRQEVLKDFPGRTETDFYVWISKHRAELAA